MKIADIKCHFGIHQHREQQDDGLAAKVFKRPYAVYGAEIKFYALPDADGAGTDDQHLFPAGFGRDSFSIP